MSLNKPMNYTQNTVCYNYQTHGGKNRTHAISGNEAFAQPRFLSQLNQMTNCISKVGTSFHNFQPCNQNSSAVVNDTSLNFVDARYVNNELTRTQRLHHRPQTVFNNNDVASHQCKSYFSFKITDTYESGNEYIGSSAIRPQTTFPNQRNSFHTIEKIKDCNLPNYPIQTINNSFSYNKRNALPSQTHINTPIGYLTPSPSPEHLYCCSSKQQFLYKRSNHDISLNTQNNSTVNNNTRKTIDTTSRTINSFFMENRFCERQVNTSIASSGNSLNFMKVSSSPMRKSEKRPKQSKRAKKVIKQPGREKKTKSKSTKPSTKKAQSKTKAKAFVVPTETNMVPRTSSFLKTEPYVYNRTSKTLPIANVNERNHSDNLCVRTPNNGHMEPFPKEYIQKKLNKSHNSAWQLISKSLVSKKCITGKPRNVEPEDRLKGIAGDNNNLENTTSTDKTEKQNSSSWTKKHANLLDELVTSGISSSDKNQELVAESTNTSESELQNNLSNNDTSNAVDAVNHETQEGVLMNSNSNLPEIFITKITSGKEAIKCLSNIEKESVKMEKRYTSIPVNDCFCHSKSRRARITAAKSKEIRMDLLYLTNLERLHNQKPKALTTSLHDSDSSSRHSNSQNRTSSRSCNVVLTDLNLFLT